MKITEVVTLHPSVAAKSEYDRLLRAGEDASDGIIAYTMDDNNPEARRIEMLRHLDTLLGDVSDHYGPEDLEDFMHDQGHSDWHSKLRNQIEKFSAKGDSYSWSHRKEYPPGTTYDFSKIDDMSDDAMIQMAKDLKIAPYHLSLVDETQDGEIPTGEYEICRRCGGSGCIRCEEGLKDITGMHKIPNSDDYKGW